MIIIVNNKRMTSLMVLEKTVMLRRFCVLKSRFIKRSSFSSTRLLRNYNSGTASNGLLGEYNLNKNWALAVTYLSVKDPLYELQLFIQKMGFCSEDNILTISISISTIE